MRATVSAFEPNILRDAKRGDVFLVHAPGLGESVVALTDRDAASDERRLVVVIASRVAPGDIDHLPPGTLLPVHQDVPITLLELVEPIALRQRVPTG